MQRRALDALMSALRLRDLALPSSVLNQIPPRPPGFGRTRELFGRARHAFAHFGSQFVHVQRAHPQVGDADLSDLQLAGLLVVGDRRRGGAHVPVCLCRGAAALRVASQGSSGSWSP